MNIRSDSMYTIKTLTEWHKKWKWNEMKNSSGEKCETCRFNTRVFRTNERQKYQIYEGKKSCEYLLK